MSSTLPALHPQGSLAAMYQTSSTSAGIFQALLAQGVRELPCNRGCAMPSTPACTGGPHKKSEIKIYLTFQPCSAQGVRPSSG